VALLCALLACAGPLRRTPDGRFHHDRHHYTIAAPPTVSGVTWKRVDVDGADLAFRGSDTSLLTVMSECRPVGEARASLLARQLLIGIDERQRVESHPVALHGDPGWMQVFRTLDGRREVEVRSVTIRGGRCVFDMLWVGPPGAPGADAFDGWWSSFQRDRSAERGGTAS